MPKCPRFRHFEQIKHVHLFQLSLFVYLSLPGIKAIPLLCFVTALLFTKTSKLSHSRVDASSSKF